MPQIKHIIHNRWIRVSWYPHNMGYGLHKESDGLVLFIWRLKILVCKIYKIKPPSRKPYTLERL